MSNWMKYAVLVNLLLLHLKEIMTELRVNENLLYLKEPEKYLL
jgi:hypothetical protein